MLLNKASDVSDNWLNGERYANKVAQFSFSDGLRILDRRLASTYLKTLIKSVSKIFIR